MVAGWERHLALKASLAARDDQICGPRPPASPPRPTPLETAGWVCGGCGACGDPDCCTCTCNREDSDHAQNPG